MALHKLRVAAILLVVAAASVPRPANAQGVQVRLNDGSTRTGAPDRSTSASEICLRRGAADAYVVFGLEWKHIAEIRDEDRVWSASEVAEYRAYLARRFDGAKPSSVAHSQDTVTLPLAPSSRPLWQAAPTGSPAERTNTSIRWIEVDAVAANWNGTLPWDGIVLRVWPMDAQGRVVPVSGTIHATLRAERQRGPFSDPRSETVEALARWTRFVRASDFGPDGVNVKLEFQNSHPEPGTASSTDRWHVESAHPDWRITGNSGDVQVRMVIPSHGVFQASTSLPVRLRRFSPLRDSYYRRHGSRFFADE